MGTNNHTPDQIKAEMSKRAQDLRIKNDKSQAEIARKLRMSSASYRKFEEGKTLLGLHYAVRLRDYWRARGENIDLDFLVTGGVEM